jgi:hypothetical protein
VEVLLGVEVCLAVEGCKTFVVRLARGLKVGWRSRFAAEANSDDNNNHKTQKVTLNDIINIEDVRRQLSTQITGVI